MTFKMTPHGVRARVPLLEYKGKSFIDLSCMDGDHDPLFLCVQTTNAGVYTVVGFSHKYRTFWYRSSDPPPSGTMTKIYLTNDTSGPDLPHTIGYPCNANPDAPFHFSFTLGTINSSGGHTDIRTEIAAKNVEESWKGSPPAVIHISYSEFAVCSVICGICTAQRPSVRNLPEPPSYIHWAHALGSGKPKDLEQSLAGEHDCTADHVADWPDGKRTFCITESRWTSWKVELSFVESKMYRDTLRLCSVTSHESCKSLGVLRILFIAEHMTHCA